MMISDTVWVLAYSVTEHFILPGKVSYGYEHEDLGKLKSKGSEHGANSKVGVEYLFSPHVVVSCEYEAADIRSARRQFAMWTYL